MGIAIVFAIVCCWQKITNKKSDYILLC